MDIESKIIDKFNEIKKLGFVKNNRPGNDGGVGNTFEDYLEVDENNQTEADFENFEVKSKKIIDEISHSGGKIQTIVYEI